MFKKSENHNPNYLAKIVKLGKPVNHPNADKLQGFIIDHNRVWADFSYNEGDVVVYFPIECCINPELLAYLNLFRDKTLNSDKEATGYFEQHGRVRALKLRGEPSEGIILPATQIEDWVETIVGKPVFFSLQTSFEDAIGNEFDCFNDIWICKKYVPKNFNTPGAPGSKKDRDKYSKVDLIVENQFRLHRDTEQLKKNIEKVKPDDIISITYKLHGTSAVFSNVLVKRKLNWFEKVLKKFGIAIQTEKYGNVYSSRSVIKDVDGIALSEGGFYDVDIWGIVNNEVKDKLLQGITLYGEIVGYLPSGKYIQSQYDYGCNSNEHAFYVYRITYTNPEGHVHEFDWQSLKDYCNKFGLNYVPELYYGKAGDFGIEVIFKDTYKSIATNFQEGLLEILTNQFLEKDCHMCKNKVPSEGIVLRIEKEHRTAFKLKSFAFLGMESKQLDAGEVDIESNESIQQTTEK